MKSIENWIFAVLVVALCAAMTAANADDPHAPGCVQVAVAKRVVVFANACDPLATFVLPLKGLPVFEAPPVE